MLTLITEPHTMQPNYSGNPKFFKFFTRFCANLPLRDTFGMLRDYYNVYKRAHQ